nr:immunoglobulin light chain junction region [Macaca mulatta]
DYYCMIWHDYAVLF